MSQGPIDITNGSINLELLQRMFPGGPLTPPQSLTPSDTFFDYVNKAGLDLASTHTLIKNYEEITYAFNTANLNVGWPGGNNSLKKMAEVSFIRHKKPIVNKGTVVSTLGNCNAFEFARYFQTNGVNYPVYEENLNLGLGTHNNSSKVGGLFNAGAVLQTINWAFGLDFPPLVFFRRGADVLSPFREEVQFTESDLERFHELWVEHLRCSRKVLENVEVLVVFLDSAEAYKFLPTGHYCHRFPFNSQISYLKHHRISLDENVELLSRAIETLRSYNSKVSIVFAVSPSPPLFSNDQQNDVFSATFLSKATLRLAVEQLRAKYTNVEYLPWFETLLYNGEIPAWDDSRHPTQQIYDKAYKTFMETFAAADAGQP